MLADTKARVQVLQFMIENTPLVFTVWTNKKNMHAPTVRTACNYS